MSVLAAVRPAFRAIATTVVPEAASLDADGWMELERIVEQALASRPSRLQRQLVILIRAIEWLPLLRYGRRFTRLERRRRARFLEALQESPLLLLRRGFWGLRTLALMGYYARPAAAASVGYHADPRGWEARR
ncbi:MAG TPA: hypothetical protein VF890_04525 [Gemmatimonadales bacterium]